MGWCYSENYDSHSMRLVPDPCMPDIDDLPSASLYKLPAPLLEGQLIEYRFYDIGTHDEICHARAIELNGSLQWLVLHRERVNRRLLNVDLADYIRTNIAQLTTSREYWLRVRIRTLLDNATVSPTNFKQLAEAAGLKFMRRIYPDAHEELWINDKIDSLWEPARGGDFVVCKVPRPENKSLKFSVSETIL